jgi:hypothetical protein
MAARLARLIKADRQGRAVIEQTDDRGQSFFLVASVSVGFDLEEWDCFGLDLATGQARPTNPSRPLFEVRVLEAFRDPSKALGRLRLDRTTEVRLPCYALQHV